MARLTKPATVAINPVSLVMNECITVTSAMRKHERWAHSSVSAILGGGPARHSLSERTTFHGRNGSSGSLGLGEDDGGVSTRWGLRGKKGKSMQDNPLLSAFARLRSDLKGCKGQIDSLHIQGNIACCWGTALAETLLQISTPSILLPSFNHSYKSFAHLRPLLLSPHSLS